MKRRTSALSVSAAALVVAAPLLTGCSADAQPGAAAVVGDETITVSQLQHDVELVREAQRSQEEADQLIAATGDLPRLTIERLVLQHLYTEAAEREGVEVTPREVQQARAGATAQFPSEEDMERELAAQGLGPLDSLDEFFRMQALYAGLAEKVGEENVPRVVLETGEEIGVEINPRYGTWDNAGGLVDSEQPWLQTPEPEPEGPASLVG